MGDEVVGDGSYARRHTTSTSSSTNSSDVASDSAAEEGYNIKWISSKT
jgi:hypothetical protein